MNISVSIWLCCQKAANEIAIVGVIMDNLHIRDPDLLLYMIVCYHCLNQIWLIQMKVVGNYYRVCVNS